MNSQRTTFTAKKITRKLAQSLLPERPRNSHKGMFGTVAIIGGTTGMIGAALMAARAALKLGAGCVHVGLLAENAPGIDFAQPELMLHKAEDALHLAHLDVIAIGCGMGTNLRAHKLLHDALQGPAALILDADALNLLATHPDLRALLAARSAATVLTPHPGEAARLLACTTGEVQQDRIHAALELQHRLHGSVVLKGADSIIVSHDKKTYINPTGNAGMSTAGMGDVLTGMIAAFIAQGLSSDDALVSAVYLHGAAGDKLAKQHTKIGMTASEVTEWARWLLNQWAM